MKFSLFGLLLLFIPVSFFILGTRTWFEGDKTKWNEFELDQLDSYLLEHDHVVVHVKSAYGIPGSKWLDGFIGEPRVRQAQLNQKLFLAEFEFRYVTGAPAGLDDEYEWVYDQPIYIKDAFFAVYSRAGKKRLFTWHDDPVSAIDSMGLVDWEFRYRVIGFVSTLGLIGYRAFNFLSLRRNA